MKKAASKNAVTRGKTTLSETQITVMIPKINLNIPNEKFWPQLGRK